MGFTPPLPSRAAGLCCLSVLVAAGAVIGSAGDARASAWTVPAGTGFADLDVTLDAGDRYFDKSGNLLPARTYRNTEVGGYVEYGITDWLMAVGRPSVDLTRVGSPDGGHYAGPGATQAGLQYRVLMFGPAVLSVQGSFRLPGTTSHQDPAVIGNTAARAISGRSAASASRWDPSRPSPSCRLPIGSALTAAPRNGTATPRWGSH